MHLWNNRSTINTIIDKWRGNNRKNEGIENEGTIGSATSPNDDNRNGSDRKRRDNK